MLYYIIISYLFLFGAILGEITTGITPNKWQLAVLLIAPIALPVFLGVYFVGYVRRDSPVDTKPVQK
jgi:hypothetical protein